MKRLLMILLVFFALGSAFGQVTISGSVGVDGTYPTLTAAGGAFAAINGTAQTGANILVTITADIATEDGVTSLNAGAWTTLTINPVGARTVSGTVAGAPLIAFNGADYVTINGLNTGGNSLVISNLSTSGTSATSTIRLYADATNNTITNCSILGSATVLVGTNGGNIFISTGTTTGNDNNTISNCLIGPAGTNLPSKGIYGNGSTTSSAIANSNITINNCEIFDFFLTTGCAGVYALLGNTDWNITNNKIYQTASRTFTAAGTMNGIYFSNATYGNNVQITGNTIGYSSNAATGTLTLLGSGFSGAFQGIYLNALPTAANPCNINGNYVSDISLASSTGVFSGIYNNTTSGVTNTININNNIIQNIATTTTTGAHYGIYSGAANIHNVTYNTVNNISRTGSGAIYGISMISPTNGNFSYNVISNLALNNATSASSVYGITGTSSGVNITFNANTIFNLTTTSTAGATLYGIYEWGIAGNKVYSLNNIFGISAGGGATIYGIYARASSSPNPMAINNNLIYNFSGGLNEYGIYQSSATTAGNIFKNKIYDLSSANAAASISGIYSTSATTTNLYNNYIGDLRATTATGTNAINGINIAGGTTCNVYYNTVFLNASSSSATTFGTSGIYKSSTVTGDYRNNIIVNNSVPGPTGGFTVANRWTGVYNATYYSATSNNNLFYAGSPAVNYLIFYDGTNSDQNLAAYKTRVAARDAASVTENPNWVSTVGTNANYLHINPAIATLIEGGGAAIGGYTDDYDGDIRDASTPDIGADEFAGISLAPVITLNSITPATTQCVATARNISVDVTTASGTITGVTITYNNGTLVGPVAMTNSAGNTWIYTIPAASPTNTLVTWSITATSSVPLTKIYTGAPYQDDPLNGYTATATASVNPVCSGSPTSLSVVLSNSSAAPTYVAPPAVTNPITDEDFGNITITKGASTILNNTSTRNNLDGTIGIPTGTAGSYSDYTTYGPYSLTAGQLYNFSASTLQGGTAYGNAIGIYIDYNRNGVFTDAGEAVYVSSVTTSGAHTETGSFTIPAGASAGKTRMRIVVNEGLVIGPTMAVGWGEYEEYMMDIKTGGSAYSWSDGAVVVGTTNPLIVNPVANTNYTCTVTALGCNITSNTVNVTTNPLPSTPTANNSTQCGTAIPSCSVTSTSGAPSPTFNWYTVPTGGTPIAGITGNTYTGVAISSTTIFYVAEIGALCESARVAVTANVVSPDAVTAAASPNPVCIGGSTTLTATQIGSTQSYTYVWTATPVAGSGIPTSVNGTPAVITPTLAGTYTYTVTATDGGCVTTASTSVVVNSLPVISSATATPSSLCAGLSTTLSAQSIVASTGTATVGSGSSTAASSGISPYSGYYEGAKAQYLILASELTSAGFVAGNLTSIKFNITTPPTLALTNYKIALASTAATGLTTTWITSGLTTVYGPVSYLPTLGLNTHTFISPYNWDGTSNILVDICYDNDPNNSCANCYSINATYAFTSTAFNSVTYTYADNTTGTRDMCGQTGSPLGTTATGVLRPNVTFDGLLGTNYTSTLNWVWNPGSLPGSTISVTPGGTTTYTVIATNPTTSCSASATVPVTVIPLPSTPTANNSTQCGTAVPTCSVTSTTGAPSPAFNWYTVPTGGTAIAGITGNTYTGSAISTTTVFYVSEIGALCESARVTVTATVNVPDAVTAAATPNPICLGNSTDLTATQIGSTNTYTYEWVASPIAGSGIPTSVSGTPATVTPTLTGTYTYTVTATDAGMGCVTTADVTVVVNGLPAGVTASASQATICEGSAIDLFSTPNSGAVNLIDQNFNAVTNDWTTTNTSTGGTPANAAWTLRPDGYVYAAIPETFHSNDNSQFYLSNSDEQGSGGSTITTLESPAFSTVGLTSCSLSFYHFMGAWATNAYVEVYDGSAWNTLTTYTTTQGGPTAFTNVVIPLNSYLNLPVVKVRFRYTASYGYYWAIDNVVVSGVGPTYSYAWTATPAGFTSSDQNPVGVIPAATTTYTVEVTNVTGCTSTASTAVTFNPLPVPDLTGGNNPCQGSSEDYNTDAGMSNYAWTVSAGGTITSGTGTDAITVTWNTAGAQTVSVSYTDGNGCAAATATVFNVTVAPSPVPTLSGLTEVCEGTAGVEYTTESGMTNYVWSISSGGSITGGGTSTDFTVTVTWNTAGAQTVSVNYENGIGCHAATPTDFSVTVDTLPVLTLSGLGNVCVGTTGVVYTTEGGMVDYSWSISAGATYVAGGSNTDSTITIDWLTAGNEWIAFYATDGNGCESDIVQIPVSVGGAPVVWLGNDTTICANQSITLDAGNTGSNFLWSEGAATTGSITVDSLGHGISTFPVWVTVDNGCVAHDTILITFDPCTGIDENGNASISVYPNPTEGIVFISTGGYSDLQVQLNSIDGKTLFNGKASELNGPSDLKEIDLSKYATGVYFIRLTEGDMVKVVKIIKQ
jgi:hypothetical protein